METDYKQVVYRFGALLDQKIAESMTFMGMQKYHELKQSLAQIIADETYGEVRNDNLN